MRRLLVAAVAVVAVAAGGLVWRATHAPSAKRAVLITIDTLRPDRTSLYGYARDTTPNLTRFFGDAAFRNARSSAPCTLPAVKQMLTGRLDMEGPTLAHVLRDAGFETSAVTSQHWFRGDELYRTGFTHWSVQGDDEQDEYGMSARRARRVTDLALDWLKGRPRRERFFLWVHYFDPHDPYDPPPGARHFSDGITTYQDGDRRAAQQAAKTDEEQWVLVDHIFHDADRDALRRR